MDYSEKLYMDDPGKGAYQEEEVVTADVLFSTKNVQDHYGQSGEATFDVDAALKEVNSELDRYTDRSEGMDYIIGVASGIVAGVIDASYVGGFKVADEGVKHSIGKANRFLQDWRKYAGFLDNEALKGLLDDLEECAKENIDNIMQEAVRRGVEIEHYLGELSHSPTPFGLMASIIIRVLRIGTISDAKGEWYFRFDQIDPTALQMLGAAILTGALNWLVHLAEKESEETNKQELPDAVGKIAHIIASFPLVLEVVKNANSWFEHLVNDFGKSQNIPDEGMGMAGIIMAFFNEITALPGLQASGLREYLKNLVKNHKQDLSKEIDLLKHIAKQAIPVAFNEIFTRLLFFLFHLGKEIADHGAEAIEWSHVIPLRNRTIDRVMMVAGMTFTVADTADAAVHAAIESYGNWVIFSGKFVARFNYIGAGRAALAVVKEISNEQKEAELIHEKLLLTRIKTKQVIDELEKYKTALAERVSAYLAEDLVELLGGFEFIQHGFDTDDSDAVIKGNVIIQGVLGRKPQFTDQKEFDDLMNSAEALVL